MKTEIRVFALVLCGLLVAELSLRYLEPRLSGDVRHIQAIPNVAAKMAADSSTVKVLWLGNSITNDGIDIGMADSLLESRLSVDVGTYVVHPDGSGIPEWYYIAKRQFLEVGVRPDVLVIPFAWNLLTDGAAVETERIGRWYLGATSDWMEFLRFEINGFEPAAGAVLANLSAAFGNRDRVRTRVLAELPGYRQTAERLSRGGNREIPNTVRRSGSSRYSRLTRLVHAAHSYGVDVVIVAMPVRSKYDLDPELKDAIARLEIGFIDARAVSGVEPALFKDEMHLLPSGAQIVTSYVTSALTDATISGELFKSKFPPEKKVDDAIMVSATEREVTLSSLNQ